MAPRVVAVILNYRTAEMALRAAHSIAPQVDGVIIVDNGSGAADASALRRSMPSAQEVPWKVGTLLRSGERATLLLPTNIGYTGGNNRGHELTRELWSPDYVLVMNPDVEVTPDLVAKGLELFSDRVGAVGMHGGYYRPPFLHKVKNLGSQTRQFRRMREIQPAAYARGALHLISREAVDALLRDRPGVFREDLFLYEDEIELGWALRRRGFKIMERAVPGVRHNWGASVGQIQAPIREYYTTRNAILMSRSLPAVRRWFVRLLRTIWAWGEILVHLARGDRARRQAVSEGLRDGWHGRGGKWRRHPE